MSHVSKMFSLCCINSTEKGVLCTCITAYINLHFNSRGIQHMTCVFPYRIQSAPNAFLKIYRSYNDHIWLCLKHSGIASVKLMDYGILLFQKWLQHPGLCFKLLSIIGEQGAVSNVQPVCQQAYLYIKLRYHVAYAIGTLSRTIRLEVLPIVFN